MYFLEQTSIKISRSASVLYLKRNIYLALLKRKVNNNAKIHYESIMHVIAFQVNY